jgi:uncharacterized protein
MACRRPLCQHELSTAFVAVPVQGWLFFAVLVLAAPRFFVSGLAEAAGSAGIAMAAGVLGFALSAVAMYTALALLIEDVHGRTVLPIGRRGAAPTALEGGIADQLAGVEHSAGVRRSL